MIGTIISTVGGVFANWAERRGRIKEAETQATIANAGKVIEQSGWKDEYIVGIWSVPAVMAFVPGGHEAAAKGFENLANAPEWYIVGWVSISLAIYGLKPATKSIIQWRDKEHEKKNDESK